MLRRSIVILFSTIAMLVAGTFAATLFGQLSGPTVGFVFLDGIHPIWGIPGASLPGPSLDVRGSLSAVEFSPGQDYGFGTIAKAGSVVLLDLQQRSIKPRHIRGLMSKPDMMAFSRTGHSAVFYHSEDGKIQLVRGLPAMPTVASEWNASTVGGRVSALAVNDDGSSLLVGFSAGDLGQLFSAKPDGNFEFLGEFGNISAITFTSSGAKAFLAATTLKQVVSIDNLREPGHWTVVANESDGISKPIAIELAENDSRLFVADADLSKIFVIDQNHIESLTCACKLTGLHRLKGSVFRITETTEQPFMFMALDGVTEDPQIFLIPAIRKEQQ